MRRVGNLFESVTSFGTLHQAAMTAARGKRGSRNVARFFWNLEEELFLLQKELVDGTWRPGTPHCFLIRDPKERMITAAPFRDRVVHHALCEQIGPVLERGAIHHSYACRVGKGTHAAVNRCRVLVRRHPFVLKCDVRRFFPSVDHGVLKGLLRRVLKDRRVLELCDTIINAGCEADDVGAGLEYGPASADEGRGLPIGNLTSQHFANFYLTGLDHYVLQELRPSAYLRYMDDFLLFSHDRRQLRLMLARIRGFLRESRKLELKESATLLVPSHPGVPFLGLRLFPGAIRLRRRKVRRFSLLLRRRLGQAESDLECSNGVQASLGSIVAHVEPWSSPGLRRRLMATGLM